MSRTRWALSLFLVVHIGALTLGALPDPDSLTKIDLDRKPDESVASGLSPLLDPAARAAVSAATALWNATAVIRPFATTYVNLTGLGQRWAMFANPPQADQYLRLRYYIGGARRNTNVSPTWTATELVFPAQNEAQIRLLQAYRDSYRDKAMAIALQKFQDRVRQLEARRGIPAGTIQSDLPVSELPDDLAPIARYFGRQFARTRLSAAERIVRTDVWYGVAPNAPPGGVKPVDPGVRQVVLRDYYEGAIEQRGRVTTYPTFHTLQREGDIIWRLEYFEEQ